jgi:glycosyltransferase involved in cell wall biosynthesis
MPNPTVSIIVPVYNTKKEYLDKCIESLVSQTLKDIELIFVDDGSTEDTLEYLRTKEKLYPQMRVIAQGENKRQGGARNTGIRAARGEYIAFCDSDDFVDKTMYEKLYKKMVSRPDYDAVRCYHKIWDEHRGSVDAYESFRKEVQRLDGVTLTEANRFIVKGGSVCTALIKKKFFVENELWFPEHRQYEDNYTWQLFKLLMRKIGFVDEDLYFYRMNEGSTTHNPQALKDRIYLEDLKIEELKRRNLFENNYLYNEYQYFVLAYVNVILSMIGFKYSAQEVFKTYHTQKGKLNKLFPNYRQNQYIIELMNEDPVRTEWYWMLDHAFPVYYALKHLIALRAKYCS